MRDPGLDGVDRSNSADLQKDASGIASANALSSKDSYTITIENLPVKLTGKYNFVFQYYYENPDKDQSTPVLGPKSATYSIELDIPCIATAPTNVATAGGFYSYQVKWDMPTFASYADTIVYESNTNSFSPSSKVVYVGTSNQCNILTSDLLPKYVYVVHRDMFRQSCIAGFVAGPITIKDPIVVDANPPTNDFTVGTATVQDDPDGLFTFNKKILFNWTANTDTSTYGYQIRFRRVGTTDYTYMSVPGRTVTSTYLYGLKAGQTYEIGVSTYDQFGNTNTSDWKSYPSIVIPPSTSLAADVAITAGDMKMGYGIGGDNANKGLYLGPENYWYVIGNTTASSAARLSVGGTNDKLLWDGTNISVTGNLTARAGSFTGNILLASNNASIYNGTINADGNLTGNGFALNATGLKVANGSNSVTLDATSGQITANAGSIGSWQITTNGLSNNNARINSLTGSIELGGFNTDDIVRLDANDANFRMWIGKNSSATAPFKVSKSGVLTASGAVITGNSSFAGTLTVGTQLSDGTTIDTVKQNALQGIQDAGSAAGQAAQAKARGDEAYNKAIEAGQSATAASEAATAAANAAALKMAAADINTVLDLNTTVINGSRITTGQIDVARLNITGGTAGVNGFVVDGNGIRATSGGSQTLNISSTGTISLGDSTNGWTVDNQYITSRSYYTTGYSKLILDGWNGTIEGGRITASKFEANTITGGTITGTKIQTSTSGNRVELLDATTDSLRVIYGGTARGQLLAAASSGILMHAGATANANATTYGLFLATPTSVTMAADSTNFLLATTSQVQMKGDQFNIDAGANGVLFAASVGQDRGQVYFQRTTTTLGTLASTTTSGANAFLNSSTGLIARSTSSRRYKTNIESIDFTDDQLKSLRPVKFQGIADSERGDTAYRVGLIAEEVADVVGLEDIVEYNEDGTPENINYNSLAPILISVVKRILNRLDALEG
jgi:hypothetical protein